MSETTETTPVKVTNSFGEILAAIQPEMVRDMIVAKLDESLNLRKEQNARVYAIRASKDTDPNSVEYQDATWARVAAEGIDPELTAKEKKYQSLLEQAEKLLLGYEDKNGKRVEGLRDLSKKHMLPALSDDEIRAKRKEYNDAKSTIETADNAASAMAEMADGLLKAMGSPIEGGVMGLLPKVESLMGGGRGRKSSGGGTRSEGGYATRIGSVKVDGKDAGKNDKYSWAILAEKLNAETNAKRFTSNEVAPLELEEAFYAAAGIEFRDKENIPTELRFEFTKDIEVQNPNDDTTKSEPRIFVIEFVKWAPAPKEEEEAATANENADGDKNADADNGDSENTESPAAE